MSANIAVVIDTEAHARGLNASSAAVMPNSDSWEGSVACSILRLGTVLVRDSNNFGCFGSKVSSWQPSVRLLAKCCLRVCMFVDFLRHQL